MGTETEIKVPVPDLGAVRRRLGQAGATRLHGPLRERNLLLDTDRGALRSRGLLLRVRQIGDRHLLTVKGPPTYRGPIKQREETEVEVGDWAGVAELLGQLGYRAVVRYEKDRESWGLDRATIALDHTPMGDFVEIEGPEEQLHAVAATLGIDPRRAVHGSYVGLWQEHRLRHPELELPPDMVFEP